MGAVKTYQEDQTVQEQSVEEGNRPGHLVGENGTTLKGRDSKFGRSAEVVRVCARVRVFESYQAQSGFIPGAEAQVAALTLL